MHIFNHNSYVLVGQTIAHIMILDSVLFVIELLTFGTVYLQKLSLHQH